MKQLLFTAQGRISRSEFWKGVAILVTAAVVMAILAVLVREISALRLLVLLLNMVIAIAQLFVGFFLGIKRYHDRNKSGWWVLIGVIPIVGQVWYFVETGFLRGTIGPNRFGPDPVTNLPASAYASA